MGSVRVPRSRRCVCRGVRGRVVAALISVIVACGAVSASVAARADATPPAPTEASLVDDLANLPYQALFAANVQVYEFAGIYRQDSPFSAPYFFTVLRKLHNANQGTPGNRRYAFVGRGPGSTLPEAFGMYPGRRPSSDLHLRWTFQFDPRTLTPTLGGVMQCLSPPTVGTVGNLVGGAVVTRACPT